MAEAAWDDEAKTPAIDWRMSASLENVQRGDDELAEVNSLEGAVRAWQSLEGEHRDGAVLTPERPVQIDGAVSDSFAGEAIAASANRLPKQRSD